MKAAALYEAREALAELRAYDSARKQVAAELKQGRSCSLQAYRSSRFGKRK